MTEYYSLSTEQKSLWIEWLIDPSSTVNNICLFYQLTGRLDNEKFNKAIIETTKNSLPFATRFFQDQEEVFFYIKENALINFDYIDETALPLKANEEIHYLHNLINNPFDLLSDITHRVILLKSKKINTYYFVACLPHILIDGYSAELLLINISKAYNTEQYPTKEEKQLLSFLDNQNKEQVTKDEQYWAKKVRYLLDEDNRLPSLLSKEGTRSYLRLNKNEFQKLKKVFHQCKTTTFLGLMTLFGILLHQYYDANNTAILYAVDLRTRKQKKLLGTYVNLIPMLIQIVESDSFFSLLSKITQQRKEDKKHQHYSLEKIIQLLRQQKKTNKFNVIFSRAKIFPNGFDLNGIDIQYVPFYPQTAIADLALLYDESEDEIVFALEFKKEAFSPEFIQQMLTHYRHLISILANDYNEPLKSISVLSTKEQSQLVQLGQAKQTTIGNLMPLNEKFTAIAKQFPENIAACIEQNKITYKELDQKSNQLARYLLSLELPNQAKIAFLLDRNIDAVITIVGIIKAGLVYIPLDASYPEKRIQSIIDDAEVRLLITAPIFKQKIKIEKLITIDQLLSKITDENANSINLQIQLNDFAYIIYTSGSTGRPKGVPITHFNLVRLFQVTESFFNFNSTDKWSLFHSFAFDFSVWEIWGALLYGGSLHIISDLVRRSPIDTYHFICKHQITIFNQTPFAFKQFLLVNEKEQKPLALRFIIFGGEKLQPMDLKSWFSTHAEDQPILVNMYGLTEATIHATYYKLHKKDSLTKQSIIGKPLPDLSAYVLNKHYQLVPLGVTGELYLGGAGLSQGFLNQEALNRKRFISPDFGNLKPGLLYGTRDLVRWLPCGNLEYIGRLDKQVKLNGYRVELDEINLALESATNILRATTLIDELHGQNQLISFYQSKNNLVINARVLQKHLEKSLPYYMIPSRFIHLEEIPLTSQGKLNTAYLIQLARKAKKSTLKSSSNLTIKKKLEQIWHKVLGHSSIKDTDTFFAAGGNSLSLLTVQNQIQEVFDYEIKITELFAHPTLNDLAEYLITHLENKNLGSKENQPISLDSFYSKEPIAIIGVAANLPGASNIEEFWKNLVQGKEGVSFFSDEELVNAGISENDIHASNYVKAKGVIKNAFEFDANFFGISEGEALILDPQHRLLLECAWTALEEAGYTNEEQAGKIGVFTSQSNINNYLQTYLFDNPTIKDTFNHYQLYINNNADFLSTRLSFKFNLTGPSFTILSGCSSSLLAVVEACKSLREQHCQLAIAGGVTLTFPNITGYFYQEGMIFSPDGHCRPFDAKANGTVPGNGAGIVVLKLLSKALADGDHIKAVIKGFAINNDGANKLSFTAPSQKGQVDVIKEALREANCTPKEISYIETHGTGTSLGDPIEIAALQSVFNQGSEHCMIGSVKSSLGHLDAAAGIISLIKTILCIKNKVLVPNLHFNKANKNLNLDKSPFAVVAKQQPWVTNCLPRRAGISAFAVGGTNVHIILEELLLPLENKRPPMENECLLLLSAQTKKTLIQMCKELALFLHEDRTNSLEDITYTLQIGRQSFPYKLALLGKKRQEFINKLNNIDINSELIVHKEPKSFEHKKISSSLNEISALWLQGSLIDWHLFYKNKSRKRLSLPTYPFEHRHYQIEKPLKKSRERDQQFQDWFYIPHWEYSDAKTTNLIEPLLFLIVKDPFGLADKVIESLEDKGHKVITVELSQSFESQDNPHKLKLDAKAHYQQLIQELENKKQYPNKILYFWPLIKEQDNFLSQELDLFSTELLRFIRLCRLLFSLDIKKNVDVFAITNGLWHIYPTDKSNPLQSLLLGPLLTLPNELSFIRSHGLDIEFNKQNIQDTVLTILQEIFMENNDELIAYRKNRRLVKSYINIPLKNDSFTLPLNGVYLITGGLGAVGLTFAKFLAQNGLSTIILLQRTAFLARKEWKQYLEDEGTNDSLKEKIKTIQDLERQGSKIHIFAVDISKRKETIEMITHIKKQFGKITGVMHAAGIAGGGMIQTVTTKKIKEVLAPKILGAINLYLAFKNTPPNFMIFCSALSSIRGDFGQVAYNSANAFLDAFSSWLHAHHFYSLSINWDAWGEEGMVNRIPTIKHHQLVESKSQLERIKKSEAMGLFHLLLKISRPEIIISLSDLNKKSSYRLNNLHITTGSAQIPMEKHQLETAWKDCLGIMSVDSHQNFFDLGADSLLGIQFISILRERYRLNINLQDLIEAPTFGALEERIRLKVQTSAASSSVLVLRKGTGNKRFFLIHPVGGTVLIYRSLAMELDPSISIYGLQSPSLDGKTNPLNHVETIASDYIKAIQAIQPQGPYNLAGTSFGGTLAYEMAQQLQENHQDISFLALFDTPGQGQMPKALPADADILAYMLFTGTRHNVKNSFYQLNLDAQLSYFLEHAGGLKKALPSFDIPHMKRYLKIYKANMAAMFCYAPKPYNGKNAVHFFKALERDPINPTYPEKSWEELLKSKLILHSIAGNHITIMFPPFAKEIAEIINTLLNF